MSDDTPDKIDPANPKRFKVVVSVSVGDVNEPVMTTTTHMMTFSDAMMEEKTANLLRTGIVQFCTGIRDRETKQTILGVYKEETPLADFNKPKH